MRRRWCESLVLILVLGATPAAAQTEDGIVGTAGGGLLFTVLGRQGFQFFAQVAPRRLPLVFDASIQSAPPVQYVVVDAPCPSAGCSPASTAHPYWGAITTLTLAPALQLIEHNGPGLSMLYRVGPAVSALLEGPPGPTTMEGLRAGVSLRFAVGSQAFLISGDYFHLWGGSADPRWFVPVTVGWQF